MSDTQSNRCGYEWPADCDRVNEQPAVPVRQSCCFRNSVTDAERCVWHADPDETDEKTVEALADDRTPSEAAGHTSDGELLDGVTLCGISPKTAVDFSDTSLRGSDLTDADLECADFTNTDLGRTNLINANLGGSVLTAVNLREADLANANLEETDLSDAYLGGARLANANLREADLTKADLGGTDLTHANLSGVDLTSTHLGGADLGNANLEETDLTDVYLGGSRLVNADLRKADLTNADLSGADLTHANIRGVDLTSAHLEGADLTNADLRGTDLAGKSLEGANLSGADLRGATLTDTNFENADLTKTDLRGSDLSGKNLEGADLSGADLRGVDLTETTLRRCELTEIDAMYADLSGADCRQADFSDGELEHVQLDEADLRGAVLDGAGLFETTFENIRINRDTSFTSTIKYDPSVDSSGDEAVRKAARTHRRIHNLLMSHGLYAQAVSQKHHVDEARLGARLARRRLSGQRSVRNGVNYFRHWSTYWMLYYGEHPARLARYSVLLIAGAALLYPLFGIRQGGVTYQYRLTVPSTDAVMLPIVFSLEQYLSGAVVPLSIVPVSFSAFQSLPELLATGAAPVGTGQLVQRIEWLAGFVSAIVAMIIGIQRLLLYIRKRGGADRYGGIFSWLTGQ